MHEPDSLHRAGVRSGALLHHLDAARHRASWPTVTAVIPTLNEADNLRWLLPRLSGVDEVIVVDGESSDETVDVTRRLRPDAVVISQPPAGKGAAMRAGFQAATSDVIVAIDADGSMDPKEIDAFVALICCGFDVVKGSRYCVGGGSDDLTRLRRAGNLWLTRLANMLYGVRWTDLCYGYIALRRSVVDRLGLAADGFEIETELCVNAITTGLRIAEIPSHEFDRRSGVSKLNARRDGLRVLRTMVRRRRGPVNRRHALARTGWSVLGLERAGRSVSALERSGQGAPGLERSGRGLPGSDRSGREPSALEQARLEQVGVEGAAG
ncbi:glycosyltransferase family 2 protein [Actinoallomurus sp. NPDC050550]|uniref:glycosyltransferase family 2 protein n=1 Tax=Actinoallomurus sp. NPDC050550 TaxID=3154937 RepID=UPI0033D0D1C2